MAGPRRMFKKKAAERQPARDAADGLALRCALRGHTAKLNRIAWSPDGRLLASASNDHTIRVWDLERQESVAVLAGHAEDVISVTWSPDGRRLASGAYDNKVRIWDTETWRTHAILEGHPKWIYSVAWSLDGRMLASASQDDTIIIWDPETGKAERTLKGHTALVKSVAWSPDGQMLASGAIDRTVRCWDTRTWKVRHQIRAANSVDCVAWSPDGAILAAGNRSSTVEIFSGTTGKPSTVLEGHTDLVVDLSFSPDGRLLGTKSADEQGTIKIWDSTQWKLLAEIDDPSPRGDVFTSLAFHPRLPVLATLGKTSTVIRIWDLDLDLLLGGEPPAESVRYTTAKIVLVGDSGVGKTGLGWRLSHGEFKEHASTHGQQFWVLDELRTERPDGTECEAVLWDLAGQHVYRPVHTIFLDDVDASLVLFDPTNRKEPLKGAQFWLEQLAGTGKLPPTVLVGARSDRGAPTIAQADLDQFCQRYGISGGYLSTSAKEGNGLEQLIGILRAQIPWDQMTTTVTTATFKRIKEHVLALKEQPDRTGVVVRPAKLRQQLRATDRDWRFSDTEMMTAVKHLANHGYVAIPRSSAGEASILLTPELLVDLASSIVLQADKHPRELGALEEARLLHGDYPLAELAGLAQEEQQILLDAAVVRFLARNICFRETLGAEALLIFPGLIKQKRPLVDTVETTDDVAYIVRGRVENVYAALVVLLGYTRTFTRVNQWQNQAQYEMGQGEICGFRLIEEREGEIELVLYYVDTMPDYGRTLFRGLFEKFLYQRDVDVTRFPPVVCLKGHRQERATAVKRIREGKRFLFCEECGEKIDLPEIEKPLALGGKDTRHVQRDEALARLRSAYETHLVRVKGFRRDRAAPRCYLSHAPQDADWAGQLAHDLRDSGAFVLEDRSQLQQGDFVIVVCTPAYRQAWDRQNEAAADARLIRARLRQEDRQWPAVVPLLLEGDVGTACPPELHGRQMGDFRAETRHAVDLFDLVLTLYAIPLNHPAFEPLRKSLHQKWEETLGQMPAEIHAPGPLKVFISYAHKDETFKDELVTMLAGMQSRGVIDAWQDRRIEEGDEWYRSIQEAMNECDLALLLVSPHFLASRFIRDEELTRLFQRRAEQGLRVVPIIVRPCQWQSEPVLKDVQAMPRDGKPVISFAKGTGARDRVWMEIANAIEARANRPAGEP